MLNNSVILAFVIFFGYYLILYFLSRVLSSQALYRFAFIELKEGLIILFFYFIALGMYYFVYEFTINDDIFGTNYSGSIYNFSLKTSEDLYNLANNVMLSFINIEGAIYQFSTFSCSGACYDDPAICFALPPNKRAMDIAFARTEYAEPFFNTLAVAKNSISIVSKTISSYYSLLMFKDIYIQLLIYGIVLRLLPGMKYVGNILFVIALIFLIILPLLIFLQGAALKSYYDQISSDIQNISRISYFGEPLLLLDWAAIQFRVLFTCLSATCDPCTAIFTPPNIEYIPSIPDLKISLNYKDIQYEIYESKIRQIYQGLFIMSVFILSATLVGMIATARVLLSLLGDRFSFIDLFLKVV
jgi:hypothetical protein